MVRTVGQCGNPLTVPLRFLFPGDKNIKRFINVVINALNVQSHKEKLHSTVTKSVTITGTSLIFILAISFHR